MWAHKNHDAFHVFSSRNRGRFLYACAWKRDLALSNKQMPVPQVTNEFKRKGIGMIDALDEAERGSTVILRCHGVPKEFYELAGERDLNIIDATCPFVEKIHELVFNAACEGKNILIVGDSRYPEVKGINGWCGFAADIVESDEDISCLDKDDYFDGRRTYRGLRAKRS